MGWKLTGEQDAAARLSLTYPADTTTYYAVWTAGGITVTFDANGGTLTGTGLFAGTTGGTYVKPADPERSGYTFDGWYTATAGGTQAASFGTYPAASVTYYAHWNANTVTVKLDPNGGKIGDSADKAQISGTYGTTVDYDQLTKDGCQFMGWKLKDGLDSTAKRSLTFPAANAEYVAVWTTAFTVDVKYSANGGTLSGSAVYTGTPGETWTAPNVADRPGYTFRGWGLDPFGTTADHAAGATMTYTTQAFTAYYALWQAANLTITLDPNGGKFGESTESVDKTGTIGQPIDYTIPAKTGYAFVGWAETADASEGNMFPTYTVALNGKTLYAVWKANTVSTAFFAMGGSGNAVLTGNIGSKAAVPADPERTGYTFVGWFTEQNGSGTKLGAAAGEDIAFAADTPAAYYANWTANTYTVTLNLNGGNIGGGTATVTCDGAYGAPVNCTEPVLDGYTFSGWKAGEADAVTKFITFPANNDTVYTAQWQVNTVTVTFNPMNGESTTVLTGNSGADMTVPANPERTGYTFDGWSLQPVSTDYKVPAGTFPTSSTAYYAQWTAKKVTVTMKLGEGTVNDKKDDVPLTGSYGAVVAYTVPTRSGYTFSGWKPEGGKDEDAVLYLTYPLDDAVYEAVWKAIPAGGGGAAAGGTIGGTLVTVPVSSDEGNTHAAVSVKDGTATVSATDEQIKEVISGTKETGTVVVDISNLSVSSAIVPAAIISAAQTAEGSTGLTVSLPTGSVTLDKTALDSTGGNDVKIEVQPVDTSDLNDAQKEKLGEQAGSATVIDVSVYVNNVLTHTFNDGKVDVSVPYTLKPGESADSITVWYLADDGSITPMHGVYDPASGTVSFTTTHLSSYVIASFPFTDVSEDAWYYGSAAYVYTHGIFAGTADTTFSPEQTMTRGMIVTVLWRMAGKPSASGASAFQDVASGAYYAQAVAWAAENGIVLGYGNGNYGPDDSITREQMAVILYRYAKYKGYDVSVGEETNILSFEDFSEVSEYAIPALQWACGAELIQGSGNKLMPRDGAVRAQAAEIFTRLCRNIAK
jgi:uncharacterized repeat protein (TIGR02543 family)